MTSPMPPERWQRIEELYHAAQSMPPEERDAFLDRACLGDRDLREELASLLRYAPATEAYHSLPRGAVPQVDMGTFLSHYRVDERIGVGGMGEVFRGVDTRLDRTVAIKVCREAFSLRFQREARALSALTHPHICRLYDVGPNFLVMELVEGETLAHRLRRGALSPAEVARYGAQVADALAHAHAKGISHRDLKPGNVMLSRVGVQLLDFGLAAMESDPLSQTGLVMGTPGYMAPEQLKGGDAGPRTDIYGLGLLLCEMATGRRPVVRPGETLDVAGLPGPLAYIVERCLAEDPQARWQSTGEIRALLEWSAKLPSSPREVSRWRWLWPAAAIILGIVAAVGWRMQPGQATREPLDVSIEPPAGTSFRVAQNADGGFALSPDGTMLVFVGYTQGEARLWVRRLNARESRPLPGTERAYFPFWSPDSKSIGFFTSAPPELKRIDVTGGAVRTLGSVEHNVQGGAWSRDGTILLGRALEAEILRVSADGGEAAPLSSEIKGRYPHFLPDGKTFVYHSGPRGFSNFALMLASLDLSRPPKQLQKGGAWPQYSQGHLLWFSEGRLFAQQFDSRRGEVSGKPFALEEIAHRVFLFGMLANYSADSSGLLVYPRMDHVADRLVWRNRSGQILWQSAAAADFNSPRISRDGSRLAVARRELGNTDVWVVDLATHGFSRTSFDPAVEDHPVWLSNGLDLLHTSRSPGPANLFLRKNGQARRITTSPYEQQALDWSSDGKHYLYTQIRQSSEIMVGSAGGGEPVSFLGHARGATGAQFNPGAARWIAYDFDDSGRREVYVQGFTPGKPASNARWQVSTAGGRLPRWRADGRELFYLSLGGEVMAVPVDGSGASFRSSTPRALFRTVPPPLRTPEYIYDVAPDGQGFVFVEPARPAESLSLRLVTDWLTWSKR
jgi:Tol biopolymer transport system component/predicted Ser/Thr protein kinase